MWITRRLLESLLEQSPYVVHFFSCITTLSEGNHGKKIRRSNKNSSGSEDKTVVEQVLCPGISHWIVFNWLESGFAAFEEFISKKSLATGSKILQGNSRMWQDILTSLSLMYIFENCYFLNLSKNLSNYYILGTKYSHFQLFSIWFLKEHIWYFWASW